MMRWHTAVLALVLAAGAAAAERPRFRVEGRHLVDPCGDRFVVRGVNKMAVWTDPDGVPSFSEIAKTGANTVRIVWLTSAPASALDLVLTNAHAAGLVPILEIHDATGMWDKLDTVVSWWTAPATVSVIRKHDAYLLANIANEAGANDVREHQFIEGYADAILRMRAAGIRVPLIIDAPGWGRNVELLLRAAPSLLEIDRDLVFSWHAWDTAGDQAARITRALEAAAARNIPLLVGEFAHAEVGCRGAIPYAHLMAEAQRLEIGWLAWSWGPGNSDCAAMDMTEDGTFAALRGWGEEVAWTDPNGICATSVPSRFLDPDGCAAKGAATRQCPIGVEPKRAARAEDPASR
ncbi:MAG: cellulase family glycosylhydrolase [Thermoanaerobaculia bacterium]